MSRSSQKAPLTRFLAAFETTLSHKGRGKDAAEIVMSGLNEIS